MDPEVARKVLKAAGPKFFHAWWCLPAGFVCDRVIYSHACPACSSEGLSRAVDRITACIAFLLLFLAISPTVEAGDSRQAAYEAYARGDYTTAFKETLPLAQGGDAWAQSQMGEMYRRGRGVKRDYAAAVEWYRKAAEQNSPYSLGSLAEMYLGGFGVEKDPATAFRYQREAAFRSGSNTPWIWRDFAHMHNKGQGTEANPIEAARWFRKAAAYGEGYAQWHLGRFYLEGNGVARSNTAARWWLGKAAGQGIKKATAALDGMGPPVGSGPKVDPKVGGDILHPFGIELGAPLPTDLQFDEARSLGYGGPEYVDAFYIDGKPPFPDAWYTIYATKASGTVYRVDYDFPIQSGEQCKSTYGRFVSKLSKGRKLRVFEDWERMGMDKVIGWRYAAQVDGPDSPVLEPAYTNVVLRRLDAVLGMGDRFPGAVGVFAFCPNPDDSTMSRLSFIHLPSLELRIAENFQADPFLKATFGQTPGGGDAPAYMTPFGIALGEPLAQEVRKDRFGEFDPRFAMFQVAPPRPHEVFGNYSALASHVSKKTLGVFASNAFEGRQVCWQSLHMAAKALAAKYGLEEPQWNNTALLGKDHTTAALVVKKDGRGRAPVDISFGCTLSTIAGDFEKTYGRPPGRDLWEGFVRFSYRFAETVADLEACVLNPEDDCPNSLRDDRSIAIMFFDQPD